MPMNDDSFDAAIYGIQQNVQGKYVFPETIAEVLTGFCREAALSQFGECVHVASYDNAPVKLVYEPAFVPTFSFRNGSSISKIEADPGIEDATIEEISENVLDAILNGTYEK